MKLLDRFRLSRTSRSVEPKQSDGVASKRVPHSDEGEASRRELARQRCIEGDDLLAHGAARSALEAYQGAIDTADACIDGHLGQARAYLALDRREDAADCLEVALALDPESLPVLRLLARVRRDAGDDGAAAELLQRAMMISPASSDILLELGLTLNRSGETVRAMEVYADAVRLSPDVPDPRVNLGLIHLRQLGDSHAAEAEFRAALAISPHHIEAAANLGLALHDQGRFEEAFEIYRRGENLHPQCAEFRWNRAIGELALGEYRAGWEGYGLRLSRRGGRKLDRFRYPEWNGAELTTGRLLVLAEQGLGDEIMFASCLADLTTLCSKVVLECAPRLAKLFTRSFPSIGVHGVERHAATEWLDQYQDIAAMAPIGSLPRFLRQDVAEFPPHAGYLRADPARTRIWRDRLRHDGAAVTVGVSWRAGTRATRGELRSIDIDQLRPLFAVPNVRFVCLQHGLSVAEQERARRVGLLLLDEALLDLDEGAALLSAIDLVISVDNTTAHLAGALGRPTWLLLDTSPDWRWRSLGQRSPWYPSVLLFRGAGGPAWRTSAGIELAQQLRAWAAGPFPAQGRFGCGGMP